MVRTWPFTARAANLERLGRWYGDRSVGGVLITGPAGVGKSRLGEEALRSASTHPSVRVTGHQVMKGIPLGALAHLLPAGLTRDLSLGEEGIARLFHGARLALIERADDRRLIVLVDDVDQLDDTSLAVLLPLAIDRTIFVIATVRSTVAVPSAIGVLVKDGHLAVEHLAPLGLDEVLTLLHRVLDGPLGSESGERLWSLSGGNLQVLGELVRHAQATGALNRRGASWNLGELVVSGVLEELVGSQLSALDASGTRVVELLALAGSLGVADLETAADLAVIEELERRGVITITVDDRRVRATLAHPVYGDVVRARLTTLQERALQRWLADRFDDVGCRRRDDLIRFARWRLEGGGPIEAGALLQAAGLALIGRDADLAQRLARAAGDRGAVHDAARIAVEAAVLAADHRRLESVAAAVWSDRSLPDGHRLHLTRRLAASRFANGSLDGALAALDEAAIFVGDPAAAAALSSQRALLLANTGRAAEALGAADAVAAVDEPSIRVELAAARSIALACIGRFSEALDAARAGAQAHGELPPWLTRRGMATHLVNEAHALAYAGHYAAARAFIDPALDRARRAEATGAEMWFTLVLGEIERDTGRGRAAVERFTAAARLADRTGQHAALVWALVGIAQGSLLLGDCAAASTALADADRAGDSPLATSWSTRERTRGWLLACRGDLPAARRLIGDVADQVGAEGILALEAALRHDLVRFGAPAEAAPRLGELATLIEGPLIQAMAEHAWAAATGDVGRYENSIEQFAGIECLVLAAEAAAEAADLHRRRGERARAMILGRRSREYIDRAGGARTPPLLRGDAVEPLTEREREVAVAAAGGLTSREIGDRLSMATRTVDTHLGRVYRKLGISRRDELVVALARQNPFP